MLQTGLLVALGWWPSATYPLPAILIFLGAFTVYLAGASHILDRAGGGVLIWVFAIVMRLVFLPLTPELSDDIYRYLWDGHVQLSGVNPYLYPPAAPELATFRTSWHGFVNNPHVSTIYPPFAQIAFLLIALAGGAILQAKLLWIGLDLATGWALGRIAYLTGRSRRLTTFLYLWSPLLLVEVAWSGHLEPLGIFPLMLLVLLARAPLAAGAAGALSALVKFAPLAAVPPLTRRLGRRFLVGMAVTLVVFYLPYAGAGRHLFDGLLTYAQRWRFMEGPFALLESVLPYSLARWGAAAVVLAVVIWTTLQRYRPERALFWILGTGLLMSPTLHPWYVLWILPFAALRLSRPWILMTGLAFLGYYGYGAYSQGGIWDQPAWIRLLMWAPVLALLLLDGARLWRDRVPLRQPLSEEI
ncbi:MAG: hypothetical protein ACE5GJ_01640 [Gemmatimonadota bacterium]